jgi:hypothetical protein
MNNTNSSVKGLEIENFYSSDMADSLSEIRSKKERYFNLNNHLTL